MNFSGSELFHKKTRVCLKYFDPGCRYLYKPSSDSPFSTRCFTDLSSLKIPSLIASFGVMPIIDDYVLFVLFTMLLRLLTQITDNFSGSDIYF